MRILQETNFKKAKIHSNEIALKYQFFEIKIAKRLFDCADWLEFALKEHIETQEQKLKLQNANFCRERYCPMCISRKSKKLAIEFYSVLKLIEQQKRLRYIFITLTVRNPLIVDLKATTKQMNEAFKRMTQTKRFKGSILGYLRATEFMGSKTPKGQAHPHYHCLFVVSGGYFDPRLNLYINQTEWQEMWQKALKIDYLPSVDVRIIKAKKETSDPIASAVAEAVKYPIKSDYLLKMSDDDFKELHYQTKGLRVLATGGIIKEALKKLKLELEDDTDLIHFTQEQEDIWRLIETLRYQFENGDYRLKDVIK